MGAGRRRKDLVIRRGAARLGLLFVCCLLPAVSCLLSNGLLLLPSSSAEESSTQPTSLHRWGAVTLFHGLPSDQVRAVAQDAEGVMWFGTDAGLARYDGRRVQSVTDAGLAGPRVRALAVDAAGALWVGADGGAFVRPAGAQSFRRVEEMQGKNVLAVVTHEPGRALLSTSDGLLYDCVLGPEGTPAAATVGRQLTVAAGKTQPVELSSIAFLDETVVVGTRGRGLVTFERGDAARGEAKEVAAKPRAFYVEALARDAEGALFFGAQTSPADSGLFKIEGGGGAARPSKVAGLATGKVTALAATPDGDLYAGTEARGVFRLRGGRVVERFTFAGTAGGLRSDTVNAVFVDREGVVWFGTPRGVCRYDPRGVRVEQLSEEAESNFVRALYRTAAGRVLVGTSRGLFTRDEAARGAWREVEEVAGKTVYSVAEDSRGLLLVGTNAGLYVGLQAEGLKAKAPVRLAPEEKASAADDTEKGPGGDEANAAAADESRVDGSEKSLRSAETAAGETVEHAGQSKAAPTPKDATAADEKNADAVASKKVAEPALSGSVRAIARFGSSVYVATFGRGLERFLGPGRRELVWPRAGQDERGREVVSLYAEESSGRLWIGTANAGVFFFDGTSVKTETALAPLERSTVWGVSSARGRLWLATSRGLYAYAEGRGLVEAVGGVDARAVVASEPDGADGSPATQAWCATAGVGLLRVALDEQFGAVASRLGTEQGLPTDNAFAVLQAPGDADAGKPGGATLIVGTTRGLARYEPGTLAPVLRLVRVTSSRAIQPEELRGGALRLEYPQNGLALDVAASASRTFPEQFLYAFTLRDAKGRVLKQKLSRDSQFQAESLPAGPYTVTARAYTLDLVPSETLTLNFEVARAPFPRTIAALSVLLAFALVALVWAYLQHRRIVRSREELREANHQLAAARLQLASEAEAERRRIARDLHDQTLADLRRLLLLTDEMQQPATSTAPAPGGLLSAATVTDATRLRTEIESISQEVRRICEDLSPSVLENVGFAAALEWAVASACAQQPASHRFAYDFACDEELEERLALAPGVQMQVYRIVQEALSNVCRHADAAHVSLCVRLDEAGDFLLRLSDDGRGFDADHKRALKGRGLAGIRARASLIEADAAWSRREGGGTVFTLRKHAAARRDDDVAAHGSARA
jgi:signal transduction histidine kinase/ligand-binding sensor domain-containing protein